MSADLGSAESRLLQAIYNLSGGSASVNVRANEAARRAGVGYGTQEFDRAVGSLERKGYIAGLATGFSFRITATGARKAQEKQG
ncbi:MAG: hypothetical protein ACFB50_16320 [Rubrobacteraceae bacterium]